MTATAPTTSVLEELVYSSDISPTATVSTDDDEFVVNVDAPGFRVDELEVELIYRSLHVLGHAQARERPLRPNVEFWFALPARADEHTIKATFDESVLTIRASLDKPCEARCIAIERPS